MTPTVQKTLLSSIAVVVATLMLAATAWSEPDGMGPRMHGSDMLARKLSLTDEQKTAADAVLAAPREQGMADRNRMAEIRTELAGLRKNWDAARAESLAAELGTLTARGAVRKTQTEAEIYQLLDDTQKEKMEKLWAKRDARMDRRRMKNGR